MGYDAASSGDNLKAREIELLKTFVLVHGAWHGGWCWSRTSPQIWAAGHAAVTPTMTGVGERSHLLSTQVGLETHVEDIRKTVEYAVGEVVLVGHSYGGLIIEAVASYLADRVTHLVFLDALVPRDGDTLLSFFDNSAREGIESRMLETEAGQVLPPPEPIPTGWGFSKEDDDWVRPRLTPHPYRTIIEPVRLGPGGALDVPRTYISCAAAKGDSLTRMAMSVKNAKDWDYYELPTGHDAMVTMPIELSKLLLEAAN